MTARDLRAEIIHHWAVLAKLPLFLSTLSTARPSHRTIERTSLICLLQHGLSNLDRTLRKEAKPEFHIVIAESLVSRDE